MQKVKKLTQVKYIAQYKSYQARWPMIRTIQHLKESPEAISKTAWYSTSKGFNKKDWR